LLRWLQSLRFLDAYAKVMTWVARFVGALFCLAACIALLSTLLTPGASPWMFVLVLLMAGIGVATLLATPITGKQLAHFQSDALGASKVSDLRQNSGPRPEPSDSVDAPRVGVAQSSPNPSLERP
jgi:hypothetical protein